MYLSGIVFALVFLAGCWLALSRRPLYGLLAYVAVFYVEPTSHWWGRGGLLKEMRWVLVAAAATLLGMIIHRRRSPASPVWQSAAFWGCVVFVLWLAVQTLWALDLNSHLEMLTIWLKFLLVFVMICGCIHSWDDLRLFLWAHVLGCFYLGWLAWAGHEGGRFEGFGSTGLAEANAGALQLVTGLMIAGALFLGGRWRVRAAVLVPAAFIANAIILTISRSGFLASAGGALFFNLFTPRRFRWHVVALSVLGLLGFVMVADPSYWQRISTIQLEGADIPGVDTGGGRLELMQAQWRMFQSHPFGCGHMCTTVLSPAYLEARFLAGGVARASHNTFMTMLVDQGIPGAALYTALWVWVFVTLRRAARSLPEGNAFASAALPGIAGVLGAIAVADMFVQYPKLEVRIWFIGVLITYAHLAARDGVARQDHNRLTRPFSPASTFTRRHLARD